MEYSLADLDKGIASAECTRQTPNISIGSKARNGLKLERRKRHYEYTGFIMPNEWEHLRGNFNEEYILRAVIAAIRVKRARAAQSRRPGALTA
jgi:hypothetical protein